MTLATLLPSLMGLWEEQLTTSIPFKGLELGDDRSLSGALWLPLLRCNPESMVGTMNPLEGNPRPSRAGRS
ncbi:hypothetical protein GFB69_01225 [Acidianus ambivalens]|uniref:Uncharacterized protein n=1 Tax=Acidianus ambivalens TaxID=2283 RepID=A0A650CYZ3_ACIAM|nr:hypothetical protein [Acidianus ambivalens]QGR22912.1 hypothetical protein D1866_09785 [Acidianus ambivalens]